MRKMVNEKGHSLVELIVAVVVLSFALLGLLNLFFNIAIGNVQAKYRDTANLLAQELTEEIKSKRFDEFSQKDGTGNWSVIGVDSGETASTKSTFDDVDDYNSLPAENLTNPYAGYTRTAVVNYVSPSDLNGTSTRDQSYKRATVTVKRGTVTYASLVTIITPIREEPT